MMTINSVHGTVASQTVLNVKYGSTISVSGNTISFKYGEETALTASFTASTGYNSTGTYNKTSGTTTTAETFTITFSPNVYSITYKDIGNVTLTGFLGNNTPNSHTYGMSTTLIDPIKAGYMSAGWFTTSDCSGEAITTLGANDYTSNITLYTRWVPTTIYFTNSNAWTGTIYAYAWKGSGDSKVENASWPGIAMVYIGQNENNQSVWKVSMDSCYEQIIFNNNGKQTNDTTIASNYNAYYVYTGGSCDCGCWNCETSKVYLSASVWNFDSPRFAVYFFGNINGTEYNYWISMVEASSNYYVVEFVSNTFADNLIFCRMDGRTETNNWDNKWNQTSNLSISGNENKTYTITSVEGAGSWNA